MLPISLLHQIRTQPHRTRPIAPNTLDAPRLHLLKPTNKHNIRKPALHHLPRQVQTRGARRAGIVGVVDRDAGHSELVEDPLAGGRVAVAVAGDAGVDVVVGDLGVQQGFCASFEAEFGVLAQGAWFDEGGEADA